MNVSVVHEDPCQMMQSNSNQGTNKKLNLQFLRFAVMIDSLLLFKLFLHNTQTL
jgi:hypothetical protein